MPIEIKELVIRAVVDSGAGPSSDTRDPADSETNRDAIVEACVKEVMRILRKSKER